MCKIDGSQKKSKQEIIQCLSEEKRNSILSERKTQMSSECQDQVTFELLGEFEDLRLNPNLQKNCLDDVKKYCNNIKKGIFLGSKFWLTHFFRRWRCYGMPPWPRTQFERVMPPCSIQRNGTSSPNPSR